MLSLKPFQEVAPGVLEVREGGGLISVFGLPFLAAGLFVTLIGTGVLRVQNAAELPWWAWPILLFMGLAFVAAGSALALGRSWTRLDMSRRRILKQWGLLSPMKTEETDLRDFHEVCLKLHGGDSDSVDRYPVVLKAGMGGKDLEIYSSTNYGEARERAVFLARFLKLPLTDASTEHPELLHSVPGQEALRPAFAAAESAPQAFRPQAMRSQVEESGESARITIPGPGFRLAMLPGLVIPFGILAYATSGLLPFFRRTHTPEPVQYAFLGFLLFLFGVLPLLSFAHQVLTALRSHTRIIISREGLTIENRGALFTRRTRVPAADILGVDYSTSGGLLAAARSEAERRLQQGSVQPWQAGARPGSLPGWVEKLARLAKSKGITVKSKAGLLNFAAGLPDDEVGYLYTTVKRALRLG
jgi:hypothetical protein